MSAKAKAHVEEEHENTERWLLTYADLITLLLGVFVVLYCSAEQDTSKFKKLIGAMAQVLNPAKEAKSGPGSGFAPPEKTGTEVFAPLGAKAEPQAAG